MPLGFDQPWGTRILSARQPIHQQQLSGGSFINWNSEPWWRALRGSTDPGWSQTSYLSRISRIISVEKNLSCGEISDFCKEFEQFMEFYRNLCRFCSKFVWRKICVEKISVEKKWQIWGLCKIWPKLDTVTKDDFLQSYQLLMPLWGHSMGE